MKTQSIVKSILILCFIFLNSIVYSQKNKLFPFFSGGKWGVADTSCTVIISNIYNSVEISTTNIVSAKKNNKYLLFDSFGKRLNEINYDSILFVKSYYIITKNKQLYGLLAPNGERILDEIYTKINFINEYSVILSNANKYCLFLIDSSIYSEKFDNYSNPAPYITIIENDGKYSLFNTKNKFQTLYFNEIKKINNKLFLLSDISNIFLYNVNDETVLQKINSDYFYSDSVFYSYKIDNELQIRNINNNKALKIPGDYIEKAFDINEKKGGISDFIENYNDQSYWYINKQNKVGLIDKNLNIILQTDFETILKSGNNLIVKKDSKSGIYDRYGKVKVPPIYDSFIENNDCFITKKDKKFGVFYNGKECIAPVYYELKQLSANYFSFTNNKKFGLLNLSGKILMTPKYNGFVICSKAIIYKNKNKFGLADLNGTIVTKTEFDEIIQINNDNFTVRNSNKYGVVRFDGRGIVKPAYFSIKPTISTNIFAVESFNCIKDSENDFELKTKIHKTGYINSSGEILLDTLYNPQNIEVDFSSGFVKVGQDSSVIIISVDESGKLIDKTIYANYIFVKKTQVFTSNEWRQKNGLWGLLRFDNKIIFPYQFKQIRKDIFENNIVEVFDTDYKFGIVNDKIGKFIISGYDNIITDDFKFASVVRCVSFRNHFKLIDKKAESNNKLYAFIGEFNLGCARFNIGGKLIYNKNNKKTLEINLLNLRLQELFMINNPSPYKNFISCFYGKWGIMDKSGNHIVDAQYDFLQEYYNSVYLAEKKGKWGVISAKGNTKIEFKFDQLEYIVQDTLTRLWSKIPFYKAKIKKYKGVIDSTGKFIINPEFSDIYYVENNGKSCFITVRKYKHSLCGIVDTAGRNILLPTFSEIQMYSNGTAIVKGFKNKYGIINDKGKLIIDTIYKNIHNFSEGYAAVETKKNWNFVDIEGKLLLNVFYKNVGDFSSGIAPVSIRVGKKNKVGYINKKGKFVIKPKFKSADNFIEELAIVTKKNKIGIINTKGKYVINPKFIHIEKNMKSGKYVAIKSDGSLFLIDNNCKNISKMDSLINFEGFSDYVIKAYNKKYATKIPLNIVEDKYENKFDKLKFYEGKAVYKTRTLYGMYDMNGKQIAETKYDRIIKMDSGIFCLKNIYEIIYVKLK